MCAVLELELWTGPDRTEPGFFLSTRWQKTNSTLHENCKLLLFIALIPAKSSLVGGLLYSMFYSLVFGFHFRIFHWYFVAIIFRLDEGKFWNLLFAAENVKLRSLEVSYEISEQFFSGQKTPRRSNGNQDPHSQLPCLGIVFFRKQSALTFS